MKVLEKPGSSVPILNGVVSGMLALWDTAKVGRYFPLSTFFSQLIHNPVACEAVERESTSLVKALSNLVRRRRSRPIRYTASDA